MLNPARVRSLGFARLVPLPDAGSAVELDPIPYDPHRFAKYYCSTVRSDFCTLPRAYARSSTQPQPQRGFVASAAEAQLLLFRSWAPRPGGAEHVFKAVSRCKWPDYGLLLTVSCHSGSIEDQG